MFYFVLLFSVITHVHTQTPPVVTTTQGRVQGLRAVDGDYWTFYGIRYGGDASGTNRFKPPTSPPSYPNVFVANEKDIICAQPSSTGLIGIEDCLRLSIFTKRVGKTVSQPVFVWLIGEDFASSNPLEHSYRRLVNENVVVVAVNYRVSIFGFLCLRTNDAPGNAGLRDVMQALEWIQKNIAEFGGDPNNIVLIGHGSGAAMVDFITLSPLSKGLVHKAVAMSGSALAPWAITRNPAKQALLFAREINYESDNIGSLATRLINTDASVLAFALNRFERNLTNSVAFAPCIVRTKSSTLLNDSPVNLLTSDYNQVPYIYSYTDKEGTIRANHAINQDWLQKMEENFADFLPIDLISDGQDHQLIRNYYFANKTINLNTIEEYLDYHGDSMIVHPLIWGARQRAIRSSALYLLEFNYRGTENSNWKYPMPLTGVPHGQFLNYILDFDLRSNDRSISNHIVRLFVDFANTGDPSVSNFHPFSRISHPYMMYYGGIGYNYTQDHSPGVNITLVWARRNAWNPQSDMRSIWEPLYKSKYDPPTSSVEHVLSFSLLVLLCQVLSAYL